MALTPVQTELGKIAADYRRYRIVRSLARCWGSLSLIGLAFLILDWTLHISLSWAVPALIGLGVAAGAWVVWRNSRSNITLKQIARLVEKDDPKLNSLLLAAAEQQPDAESGDLNFLQIRLIREALEANRRSPWQQKFVERLFFAQCSHVAALVALSVVLAWLAMLRPNSAATQIARNGIEITPGNIEIERGSALAIVAHFPETPPNEVTLVYRTKSGGETILPMTRSLSDPLFGASFTDVREDTTYQVRHGDRKLSPEYQIKVFDYPELKRADAALEYPTYTAFAPVKIEDTRRITAVEGTDVHYTFYLNKPVRSAALRAKNGDGVIHLTNSPAGEVIYESHFAMKHSGHYLLELVDEAGRSNKLPAEFVFVAQENQAPKLKLVSPGGDQRVSALQEVRFEGRAEDDFGLSDYGIAYTFVGRDTEVLSLVENPEQTTKPHESRTFASLLSLEKHSAEVGEFVSFYIWADDLGPDGSPRRTASDIYFAEVRPFEEIFREGNGGGSSSQQQQQQGQNNPAGQLLELQKEIITATWNLHRRESGPKPSKEFKADAELVHESQSKAAGMADAMKERLQDDKSKALINTALREMTSASEKLKEAAEENKPEPLFTALDSEQAAYQALLKLQAREFQVQRSQRSQSGGQQSGAQQRAQRQLDQLELSQEENRYETETEASPLQSAEQRETLQVLNRLKELARRQEDLSERLKELQIALNQAKTEAEKEELERQLKRLQEEQRQIVQDMDEVRQRMSRTENQSRMAEARKQLEETRKESREAAEQLQQGNVGQALSSSSKAEEQLEKLSDEMRRSTSSQFAEEMQQMRQQARELEQKQEELTQKIQENKDSRRRTLTDQGPREEALRGLAQQQAALTNLLQNMRTVTEQAEAAEPLLSRQLYETLRRTSQANPEQSLELTSQLLERNFLPQALQTQEKATDTIRDLKEGVENAANSVLGDEAESLRFAQAELEKLTDRVERELNAATAAMATNSASLGTNGLASTGQEASTNGLAIARKYFPHLLQTNGIAAGGDVSTNGINQSSSQQGSASQQELASNRQPGQQGEQDQGEESQSQSQNQGQQQANSNGSQSEGQGQQPGGSSEQQVASNSPQGGQQQASSTNPQREGNQNQQRGPDGDQSQQAQQSGGGSRNFYEQWANNRGNRDGGGGGGTVNGPLTGDDYTSWSDRLRDLEEVLQDPALRTDVARIRERARTMRAEFKRDATEPQWDLVETEIVTPLRILQNRVAEQLARHESPDAVVPLDRDPVPARYSELVSRYYETLGKD